MVKVAWKVINGHGPYAYLQKSVKTGNKVKSEHVAYLGKVGTGGVIPGKHVNVPKSEEFEGGRIPVPYVGDEVMEKLKPGLKSAVQYIEHQSKQGLPAHQIMEHLHPPGELAPKKTSIKPAKVHAGAPLSPDQKNYYQDMLLKLHGVVSGPPKTTSHLWDLIEFATWWYSDGGKTVAGPGPVPGTAFHEWAKEHMDAGPNAHYHLKPGTKDGDPYPAIIALEAALSKDLGEKGWGKDAPKKDEVMVASEAPSQPAAALQSSSGELGATAPSHPAPDQPAATPSQPVQIKVSKMPMTKNGNPVIPASTVAKYEQLASAGDSVGLNNAITAKIKKKGTSNSQIHVLHKIHQDLDGQMKEKIFFPASGAGAEQPAGPKYHVELEPTSTGPKPVMAGHLVGALKDKLGATIKPSWTKVGAQLGSTPGGMYEDQLGHKYYIKCPATEMHVKNELLARDLYKLAGVDVLDAQETELDGKPCIASKFIESLSCTGINPKDIPGTTEGFAADAWLANWDSVGVGTTKYDNICPLNGQAYRVDTGGALLYRGTGGAKGEKFGNEVTELEGLRDPALNPVAATVYGDMNLDQIRESAKKVTSIPDAKIKEAVANRFGDTEEAKALAKKLLARKEYIAKWVKEDAEEDTKVQAAETLEQPAPAIPKVGPVPKDNKGKELVTKFNVKKLEALAGKGNIEALEKAGQELAGKMKHAPKKAAVLNVVAELKGQMQGVPIIEGDGGSGLGDTMGQVDAGEVKLPEQSVPSNAVVEEQTKAVKTGKKSYNKDLEQVSGKKGSNEGGLFKDKKLQTLHYIKWPNSPIRAKMEALAALLYAYADVPAPTVRVVKFKGKDAVMSDWIEDATPMSSVAMKGHKDVRENFAADAWLANWDVVGLSADNIVKGPGGKAYRIDMGGSLLFRAQGKGKKFPSEVGELDTMRDASIAPQAAAVFEDLTPEELKESAGKLDKVTDGQIDQAVDSVKLPKKSTEYPTAKYGSEAVDIPALMKKRLKERRDFILDEFVKGSEKKQAALAVLQEKSGLKQDSLEAIADKAHQYSLTKPTPSVKWYATGKVIETEYGKTKGAATAINQLKSHYGGWKGSSNSDKGLMLRWAAGEITGDGRRELARIQKWHEYKKKKGHLDHYEAHQYTTTAAAAQKPAAKHLVKGLKIAGTQNEAVLSLKHPGQPTVTVYRGWKADQAKYLKMDKAQVGDTLELKDPPLYSWSFAPQVAQGFGHGSIVTKAEVPLDKVLLTDMVNPSGLEGEDEVLFKGIPVHKMEVIKKN